jgi:hypothetical protein
MSARGIALRVVAALVLTLASTVVKGTRVEYQGWDCSPGERTCPRPLVAAGFPLPFIVDKDGLSPGNAADLSGALLGLDAWRWGPFWIDLAVWTVVAFGGAAAVARARRR